MKKNNFLKKKSDLIFVEDNFLNEDECDFLIKKIPKLGAGNFSWDQRTVDITNSFIVTKVINFFKKKLNFNLKIQQAQIQNWNVGSESPLHIHDHGGRNTTKFNSLIYLNNNFEGGEFYTKNGIVIKPKKGLLTLFNGKKVYHGVKKVSREDIFTLIFWWEDESK